MVRGRLESWGRGSTLAPDLTFDVTLRMWITLSPVWTENGLRGFFRTHPVDGITAGSDRVSAAGASVVPRCIPSLRTVPAACLHRLSTDLCTARLDVSARPHQTVRPGDYNRVRPAQRRRFGVLCF